MVELKKRFFCIWGNDFSQHQLAVENIKKKVFPASDTAVNINVIYSKQTQLKDFQEKVFTMSFSGTKLIIIKNCNELADEIKNFIMANAEKIAGSNHVIFETEKNLLGSSRKAGPEKFLAFLAKNCLLIKADSFLKEFTVDDLARSIYKRDYISALYIVEKLYEKGAGRELGTQILGIMNSASSRITNSAWKEKYLTYIFEADRMIKNKGLDSRLAIELLIAKILQEINLGDGC